MIFLLKKRLPRGAYFCIERTILYGRFMTNFARLALRPIVCRSVCLAAHSRNLRVTSAAETVIELLPEGPVVAHDVAFSAAEVLRRSGRNCFDLLSPYLKATPIGSEKYGRS
jgi:hypothetical protein